MPYKDPEKQKEAQHQSYLRNKIKIRYNTTERKQEKREFLRKIKEASSCVDCNQFYPYYVMEFDHRDSSNKLYNLAHMVSNNSSLKSMVEEITKCDLVCSNCHRERTYGGDV